MQGPSQRFADKNEQERQLSQLRAMIRHRSVTANFSSEKPANAWQRLTGEIGPRRLIDCLAATQGSGCGLVALQLCNLACQERGELVVIDGYGSFYPPAAIGWGIDAERLVVVAPSSAKDALAATEIALRSPAAGAVWASLDAIGSREFRRLLLATEAAEAFGVLVRSTKYASQPSWGDVQLRFDPVASDVENNKPFLVRVTQTRNRHGPAGGSATLSIDWQTGRIEPLTDDSYVPGTSKNTCHLDPGLASATRSA